MKNIIAVAVSIIIFAWAIIMSAVVRKSKGIKNAWE